MPAPSISAIPLSSLQKQSKSISPAFITKMKKAGIQTLQDIRKAGGIPGKESMPAKEQESARHLEAHAYLSLLSEDMEVNEKLIGAGIGTFSAIAGTNKTAFLERAKDLGIPEDKAAALHAKAEAAEAYLTHMITAARVENANNYAVKSKVALAMAEDGVDEECDVQECNSAVSPLAYLTELLGYAQTHIKSVKENSEGKEVFTDINLAGFEELLHQPFGRFTNACEEVDKKVRQVRIATEVLRKTGLNAKEDDQNTYCLNAYKALLIQIGTSYDELRRIKSADAKKRQVLADRIGIDLDENRPDELDKLLLREEEITEAKLEQLFGLQDTTRDPLSNGVFIGSDDPEIKKWEFYGVDLYNNTDAEGKIYASVRLWEKANHMEGGTKFQLFKSADKLELLAEGQRTEWKKRNEGKKDYSTKIPLQLKEQNSSGLSALVDYSKSQYSDFYFYIIPDLLRWRLKHLRTLWKQQDNLSDDYFLGKLPVVDPDLIGPEDFRNPLPNKNPFKLWKKRREWVDGRLIKMHAIWHDEVNSGISGTAILDKMLKSLNTAIEYDWKGYIAPAPWKELVTSSEIRQLNNEIRKTSVDSNAHQEWLNWLKEHGMTKETFARIAEIADKAQKRDTIAGEEWTEIESILIQVQKNALIKAWVLEEKEEEEKEKSVFLSYEYFWKALQEPVEGSWSPALFDLELWIDPEIVKKEQLVLPPIGKIARETWDARKKDLDAANNKIRKAYIPITPIGNSKGLIGCIVWALGEPLQEIGKPKKTWEIVLPELSDLISTAPDPDSAARVVNKVMYKMPVEDFVELYELIKKEQQHVQLLDNEVERAVAILTSAWKRKTKSDIWKKEESDLQYWQVFAARLPKWRAGREARAIWQMALKQHNQIPAIDPDLLDCNEIKGPGICNSNDIKIENAAKYIYNKRQGLLRTLHNGLIVEKNNKLIIALSVWRLLDEARKIEQIKNEGKDIQKYLEQSHLSYGAFDRLCVLGSIAATEWDDSEKDDLRDIVLQDIKVRNYAAWKKEEMDYGITISPDFFDTESKPEIKFGWRANSVDRWDWEDRLKSRNDQEIAVYAAMAEAVDKAEEHTITQLRDVLIKASTQGAKSLSQELLVDMEISPCQKTTRIAVAINTLQELFFLLQTEQNTQIQNLNGLILENRATTFEGHWKWLGSYETWRAAVGVFLYPENILLPALRKTKSELFVKSIEKINEISSLNSKVTNDIEREYEDYLNDIINLELFDAIFSNNKVFLLARGNYNINLYYSTYDYIFGMLNWKKIPNSLLANWTNYLLFQAGKEKVGLLLFRYDYEKYNSPKVSIKFIYLYDESEWENSEEINLDIDPEIGEIREIIKVDDFSNNIETQTPETFVSILVLNDKNLDYYLYIKNLTKGNSKIEILTSGSFNKEIGIKIWGVYKLDSDFYMLIKEENLSGTKWVATLHSIGGGSYPGQQKELTQNGDILHQVYYEPLYKSIYIITVNKQESPNVKYKISNFTFNSTGNFSQTTEMPEIESYQNLPGDHELKIFIFNNRYFVNIIDRYAPQGAPDYPTTFDVFTGFVEKAINVNYPKNIERLNIKASHSYNLENDIQPIKMVNTINSVEYLQKRKFFLENIYKIMNDNNTAHSVVNLVNEAFYFIPIAISHVYYKINLYEESELWSRKIYDYTQTINNRRIFNWLSVDNNNKSDLNYNIDWDYNFKDINDVHKIASLRKYPYLIFDVLHIARTLIAHADSEFTRDTSESIKKSLLLYKKAKELLACPELHPYSARCKTMKEELETLLKSELVTYSGDLIKGLKKANNRKTIAAFSKVLGEIGEKASSKKIEELNGIIRQGRKQPVNVAQILERGAQQDTHWRKLLKDASVEQTLVAAVQSAPIFRSGNKSAGTLYLPKVGMYGDFPIPWNPLVQLLYLHVENNLNKIRTCRNIAGVKREVETYAAATDVLSAMPSIGTGGQLVLPTSILPPPVPYRYEFLIERAKQLVNIAIQMEAAFLNAMEKRDVELYGQLKARQDIQLAQAGVKLQNLRLRQAKDEINLADLQKQSAEIQFVQYENWLNEGMTQLEKAIAGMYIGMASAYGLAASLAWLLPGGAAYEVDLTQKSVEATISTLTLYANQERKEREWEFQRNIASNTIQIGNQQIKLANDGVDITDQEVTISKLQVDHAKDIIEFLREKDTNAELYDWMQGILRGIYSYFLQQATAMAKLAQNQLAFERQEPSPSFIQHDYWVISNENAMGGSSEDATDRFGLTGSARLLADIYKLDQYHFDTEKRKLQLTKNISLARVAPFELQRFKETGVLTFQTPMQWFDQDFPGHYLRMIKRVRTSVVALIPPVDGIKATLSNIGVSRIVVDRNELFQPIIAHRPPESVALTSPSNATGLFELESQNTSMMLPFEGLGVDTLWEFRMPKAANQFDYSTIADIILSIDYTALDNYDYRLQVIESLPKHFSGDRPYSFRYQFADAWYDLHNPDQSATPMTVTFRTRREDFPPNLDRVTIQQVLLYFAVKDKAMDEQEVALTFLADNGESVALGGSATPVDGIISTRRGNGSAWLMIQGQPVAGTWTLTLPNTARNLFAEEKIEDMLLVLTINGVTPEWPA